MRPKFVRKDQGEDAVDESPVKIAEPPERPSSASALTSGCSSRPSDMCCTLYRCTASRRSTLYGQFTLQVSDAFTFDITETKQGLRLDFRRRTLRERVEVWRRKWGL